jgi:hypothetical protein
LTPVDTMRVPRKDRPVTNPPPPDPISPPSLPPPDAVLQPPPPLPWEQPWQAPEPPTKRKVPRDPVIITRPAPSTRPSPAQRGPRTAAPKQVPPAQATPRDTVSPQTWRRERKRRKRPAWLTIGIVVALAICGGNIIDGIRKATDQFVPSPAQPGPARVDEPPASIAGPDTIVDGGEASFDLPVGTGVRFTDQDGTWIVGLTRVTRVDDCESLLGDTVSVVVFDIAYEVTEGVVSVIPTTDFAFELSNGTTVKPGLVPACADSPLDMGVLFAGDQHRGRIAIELASALVTASGELTYGQLGTPTASWTVS